MQRSGIDGKLVHFPPNSPGALLLIRILECTIETLNDRFGTFEGSKTQGPKLASRSKSSLRKPRAASSVG